MAMIKCPECGHHISSLAHTCPECGYPIDPAWAAEEAAKVAKETQEKIDAIPFTVESDGENIVESEKQPEAEVLTEETSVADEPVKTQTNDEETQAVPQKSNGMKWFLGIVIVAGLILGGGYYLESQRESKRELRDYEMLEGCTNPAFYEDFLIKYPKSEYYDEVRQRFFEAQATNNQWEEIKKSGDRQKIVNYMRLHPSSPYVGVAKNMIDSIDWFAAKEINTVASMETYMDNHRDGLYYDQAESTRRSIIRQQEEAARRDTMDIEEAAGDSTASTSVTTI